MNNSPYTLLYRSRPARIVFLVDLQIFPPTSDRFFAIVEAIVEFNRKHWGGRLNHIVFYLGDSLESIEWQMLEEFDADYIQAFSPISTILLRELNERLNPCEIRIDNKSQVETGRLHVMNDWGISMQPTPNNLRQLCSRGSLSLDVPPRLLVIGFAPDCDPAVKQFVNLNFGTYEQQFDANSGRISRDKWLEKLLIEVNSMPFLISDVNSLSTLLTAISGRFRRNDHRPSAEFVLPQQLTSLYTDEFHWPFRGFQNVYQLIVGDSPEDLSEHWNGARWKGNCVGTHGNQLWIPRCFATNEEFLSSLHDWISRYRRWDGGWRVELITHSLPADEAAKLMAYFKQGELFLNFHQVNSDRAKERCHAIHSEYARRRERFRPWTSDKDVVRLSVSSSDQVLSVTKAEPLEGHNRSGTWMLDVQIEHLSKHRESGQGHFWWYLPRLKGGSVACSIFRTTARINAEGRFSARVQNVDERLSRRIKPELRVRLLDDMDLLRQFVLPFSQFSFSNDDPRSTLGKGAPALGACRVSAKGSYLAALLRLFRDFETATTFCERKFWRTLFRQLAGQAPNQDSELSLQIAELLKESVKVKEGLDANSTAKSLSDRVLHLVRGRLQGHYMTHRDCVRTFGQIAKATRPGPLVVQQGMTAVHTEITLFTREEMDQGLDLLLELGVLRLGIESECPRCKLSTWYYLDDLTQHLACAGCSYNYTLSSQEHFSYGLNSLAQMSVLQGVLGVLHALTAIASYAHNFFVFAPSLDLFRPEAQAPWREIDLMCIADGEFVIGEVKEGYVQKKTLEELEEIALVLKPDRAVIFVPLEHASQQGVELQGWVRDARERLRPLGISFEVFALPEL
jgi:hypothetical protein